MKVDCGDRLPGQKGGHQPMGGGPEQTGIELWRSELNTSRLEIRTQPPKIKRPERPQAWPTITQASGSQPARGRVLGATMMSKNVVGRWAREKTSGSGAVERDGSGDATVLVRVWSQWCSRSQRPRTRPMTHRNKHLRVKLFGQKGMLCDTSRFPRPLQQASKW